MSHNPKVTFCSGVGTVTGANFLLETPAGAKILIDCGLVQGQQVALDQNREPFIYDPKDIDALIVTHAHLDHVGRIPKLVKEGYSGPIYSTSQTRDLGELVLNDAVGILHNEAQRMGKEQLYGRDDLAQVFPLWKTVPYHEKFNIEDVVIELRDAGHILGSAMIEITFKDGKKILFSGDLGNSPHPLLRDAEEIGQPDYVVIESVYGDRNHEPKEMRSQKLESVIKETIARGGTLVIPAFSVDRTQVFLYELNNMIEQGKLPSVPVFLDSPLATEVTRIYQASIPHFNDRVQKQIGNGDNIFKFPRLQYTVSSVDSKDIDHLKSAKIILAGSGMSVGGRVISHEANYLPDARNTILLVGYQTTGSLGRQLSEGAKSVDIYGKTIKVKAHIEKMYGYSAHRDSDHLVEFVSGAANNLKKVFVAMGEPKASMHLAQRINDETGINALMPEVGKEYELI